MCCLYSENMKCDPLRALISFLHGTSQAYLRKEHLYKDRYMCAHACLIKLLTYKMFEGMKRLTDQTPSSWLNLLSFLAVVGGLKFLSLGKLPHIHLIKDLAQWWLYQWQHSLLTILGWQSVKFIAHLCRQGLRKDQSKSKIKEIGMSVGSGFFLTSSLFFSFR